MNIQEMTDMFVNSFESNNGKYIPWWDGDHENSNYYYDIFRKEDIEGVHNCVMSYDKADLLKPVGSMGVTLFHMLVWHNFYDEVKYLIDEGIDVNVKGESGTGILKDVCIGVTPLLLACYQGNAAMAELLINAGADICAVDEKGRNAYIYLSSYINNLSRGYECVNKSLLQRRKIVRMLGDGISAKDNEGMTAFEYMLQGNRTDMSWALSKAFIEKCADCEVVNAEGDTLLIQAIKNYHMTAAIELSHIEEIVNKQNNEGKTALHYAVYNGNMQLCMALMDRGADKDIKDNDGITPLDMAADSDEDIEKYIKTRRIDLENLGRITSNAFAMISDDSYDDISIAIYLAEKFINEIDTDDDDEMFKIVDIMYNALTADDNCTVLDICKKAGIDFVQPIYYGGLVTYLRDECLGGNYGIKVVKKYVEMGIDMNEAVIKGRTPVNIVASKEERNMFGSEKDDYFEKIIDYVSVDSIEQLDNEGMSAIHYAARRNHSDMIKAMAAKGADINITEDEPACSGNTPLHEACEMGNKEAVKVLIEAGADDTLLNVNGITAAHYAVKERNFGKEINEEDRIAILEILKNIDVSSSDGKTPLMLAQSLDINSAYSVTTLLIDRGADVNKIDNDGNTALILNTKNNSYKNTVKALIKAGADVNVLDKNGNSALYYALVDGDQESARFMIKKGADYNHENNNGVTPMQIAVEKGYDNVLEMMIN